MKLSVTVAYIFVVGVGLVWARGPEKSDRATGRSVVEIVVEHDRGLIADLGAYLEKNPKAADAEQAYLTIFTKAIEHDWYGENEARAKLYVAEHAEGPVRPLARIVISMARAKAGQFDKALLSYNELMNGLGGQDQEEFAANFADTFASTALAVGEYAVARKAYEKLLDRFGANPALKDKIGDDLARIDRVGKPAPGLIVNDVKGKPFRLDELKGKYVLVDFWATWCAPCVTELPRLQAMYAKYSSRGFEIVSVSLDETPDAVFDFVKARQIPWRQIHNPTCGGDAVAAFGVGTIPATFLIDPKGKIVRIELRGQALEETLKKLLP